MSLLSRNKNYALNTICPYFTMFPLEFPLKHLKKYKRETSIVLDPFCGRGTTLYAARKLGIKAYGIDSSPVAVAIARAKLASCSMEEILDLAQNLVTIEPVFIPENEFFSLLYEHNTLKKICALREGLLKLGSENDAAIILRALCLGALHGPLPKSPENSSYFSNQMPRTFSSKPDYSIRYWKKHNYTPPKIDVVQCLKKRLERLTDINSPSISDFKKVVLGNSQNPDNFTKIANDFSIVITSPPYFGMRTYVQDQWIRNWFLGGESTVQYNISEQLDHNNEISFTTSLSKVWKNVGQSQSDTLRMFIRFGIIPSAKTDVKKLILASLEESDINWRLISLRNADTAHKGMRQATQMKTKSQASIEYDFHIVRQT